MLTVSYWMDHSGDPNGGARETTQGAKGICNPIGGWNMARKLKIMENEKNPLDNLKNDEITEKREK